MTTYLHILDLVLLSGAVVFMLSFGIAAYFIWSCRLHEITEPK